MMTVIGRIGCYRPLHQPIQIPITYEVAQEEATGNFDPVEDVRKRIDVRHTLLFKDYKPAPGSSGFNFIEAFQSDLLEDESRYFDPDNHFGLTNVDIPADGQPDAAANVASYFVITATGSVKFGTDEGLSFVDDSDGHGTGTPQLQFHLESDDPVGTASSAVTITYHVVTCADDPDQTSGQCDSGDEDYEWRSASKTLAMTIVRSSEPLSYE